MGEPTKELAHSRHADECPSEPQISLPKLESFSFLNYKGMLSNCLMTSCFVVCLTNHCCQQQVPHGGESSKYLTVFSPSQGFMQTHGIVELYAENPSPSLQICTRDAFLGTANPFGSQHFCPAPMLSPLLLERLERQHIHFLCIIFM